MNKLNIKGRKSLVSLVLVTVLILSIMPMNARADDSGFPDWYKQNSSDWHVLEDAITAAENEVPPDQATIDSLTAKQNALEQENAEYREEQGWGFDSETGSTTTSGGESNAGSGSANHQDRYADPELQDRLGLTDEQYQNGYNQAGEENREDGWPKSELEGVYPEKVVIQNLLDLTDEEVDAYYQVILDAKKVYDQLAEDRRGLDPESDEYKELTALMDAQHNIAEAQRGTLDYTGDFDGATLDFEFSEGSPGIDSPQQPSPSIEIDGYTERSSYTVTVSTGANGEADLYVNGGTHKTVSASSSGSVTVASGGSVNISITPDFGYQVDDVKINGSSQGAYGSIALSNIRRDYAISITFKKIDTDTLLGKTHTITASAGNGGTISPSGTVSVVQGGNKTFTITPDTGFAIQSVIVDGVNAGAISSYEFKTITANHTISTTFKSLSEIDLDDFDFVDADGDSLNNTMKSGYGFFADLELETQYVSDLKVEFKYNFGQGEKTVQLKLVDGEWAFPKNAESPLSRRCVYVPVETADRTYTCTIKVTGTGADGASLSKSITKRLTIDGSMYEDDFSATRS